MAAHVEQRQPWTITLRAKAKNLDLKFKLLKNLPVGQLFRFSVHFKRRHYTFAIKSKPKSSFSLNRTSLKLKKFLRIFKKFQVQRSKNKGIAKIGRSHKNYFYEIRKPYARLLLWGLLLSMVGCSAVLQLGLVFRQGCEWKYVWWAWNYVCSLWPLYTNFPASPSPNYGKIGHVKDYRAPLKSNGVNLVIDGIFNLDLCAMVFEVRLLDNSREWFVDTCATCHICYDREAFSN